MKIHSMKLAQALPNETSLILFSEPTDKRSKGYEIKMADRGYFEVTPKAGGDTYLIFPANIAWLRCTKEDQVEVEKKKPGRPAKSE